MGGGGHARNRTRHAGLVGRAMSKRAKRIIATAALLAFGGALVPATVANDLDSYRSCGRDGILYDPSTDDIAVYYEPLGKWIVFPLVGQVRYIGRARSTDYAAIGSSYTNVDPQWRLAAAKEVNELRATGRCKTAASG